MLSQYGTATASNTLWYHGKISSLHRDGSYDIVYDNGDIGTHATFSILSLIKFSSTYSLINRI